MSSKLTIFAATWALTGFNVVISADEKPALRLEAEVDLAQTIEKLGSDSLRERCKAEAKLLGLSENLSEEDLKLILEALFTAKDPAVTRTVRAALYKEFLHTNFQPPGFLGIALGMAEALIDGQRRIFVNVERIVPGSPAEEKGLQLGDLIIGFENEIVEGIDCDIVLRKRIAMKHAGQECLFEVFRDGELLKLKIPLAARDKFINPRGGEEWIEQPSEKEKEVMFSQWLADTQEAFRESQQEGLAFSPTIEVEKPDIGEPPRFWGR